MLCAITLITSTILNKPAGYYAKNRNFEKMKNTNNIKKPDSKRYTSIQRKWDALILSLEDCDGMCNLCKPSLKTRCFRYKGIGEKNPSYPGLSQPTPKTPAS